MPFLSPPVHCYLQNERVILSQKMYFDSLLRKTHTMQIWIGALIMYPIVYPDKKGQANKLHHFIYVSVKLWFVLIDTCMSISFLC